MDGSFKESECKYGVVPFKIANEEFNNMFVLVDDTYMNYAKFAKGIKIPSTTYEETHIK